jgi:hypothetical protein
MDSQFSDIKHCKDAIQRDASASIQLNPAFLKAWNSQATLPCPPPFKATFEKHGKQVTFFATQHVQDNPSSSEHQLAILKHELEQAKPSAVLIEMETGNAIPRKVIQEIARSCFQNSRFVCTEAEYAAIMGDRLGSTITGAEPIPPLLSAALQSKLSHTDLLAYRSTQVLLTLKREGKPIETWPENFNAYLARDTQVSQDEWSYQKFESWLLKAIGKKPAQIDSNWIAPFCDKGSTELQNIACEVEKAREPLIVQASEKVIRENSKTFIVYGAGHFFKESAAYERAFGQPKIECLSK